VTVLGHPARALARLRHRKSRALPAQEINRVVTHALARSGVRSNPSRAARSHTSLRESTHGIANFRISSSFAERRKTRRAHEHDEVLASRASAKLSLVSAQLESFA